MKKFIFFIISVFFLLAIYIFTPSSDLNATLDPDIQAVKEKLAPYQAVIDKINSEYGASINIPENELFEVYNRIKDLPVNEFESKLRKDYESVKDLPRETYIDTPAGAYIEIGK